MDPATWRRITDACNHQLLTVPVAGRPACELYRMSADRSGEWGYLVIWHCAVLSRPIEYASFSTEEDAVTWARERGYALVRRWLPPKAAAPADAPEWL